MSHSRTAERADFQKAWQQNGTAKVEAFLSPRALSDLQIAVHTSYDLLRQHVDDDPPVLDAELARHFRAWEGMWVKGLRDFLAKSRPDIRVLFDNAIIAAEIRFRALFGWKWRLEPFLTFVRRHRSSTHYLPWHIDADAAGAHTMTDYSINAWLPLDPVGDTLPSLELMPGSNKTMRNIPSPQGPLKDRDDAWVKDNIGGESWIPHALPGDAILFDHWTLHRTQQMAQETGMRTSCEFRFLEPSLMAICRSRLGRLAGTMMTPPENR